MRTYRLMCHSDEIQTVTAKNVRKAVESMFKIPDQVGIVQDIYDDRIYHPILNGMTGGGSLFTKKIGELHIIELI